MIHPRQTITVAQEIPTVFPIQELVRHSNLDFGAAFALPHNIMICLA